MSNILKYAIVDSDKVTNIVLVAEEDTSSYIEQFSLENPTLQIINIPIDSIIGVSWNYNNGTFLPKKPYEKWILDESGLGWIPPIKPPQDGKRYEWSDESNNWILFE